MSYDSESQSKQVRRSGTPVTFATYDQLAARTAALEELVIAMVVSLGAALPMTPEVTAALSKLGI